MAILQTINDARIFPRLALIFYCVGMAVSLNWYLSFEVQFETKCDAKVLEVLLNKSVPLIDARALACSKTNVIGRPNGYTALLATMVGAGPAVFSFYVSSGARREPENKQ